MTDDIITADGIESLTVADAAAPDDAEFVFADTPARRNGDHSLAEFTNDS